MKDWIIEGNKEAFSLAIWLIKVTVPVLILVKILTEMGFLQVLANTLEPTMASVGLPGEMAFVIAAAMLVEVHAGLVLFATIAPSMDLSVAQVTVAGAMMLVAHALPLEGRIAQLAGIRLPFILFIRISTMYLVGWLLYQYYQTFDLLQIQHEFLWIPEQNNENLTDWVFTQLKNLSAIIASLYVLIFCLKLLKLMGIEKLLIKILSPLLRIFGVNDKAVALTIVGFTLGLTYGGGLMIKEANSGHVSPKEMLIVITLLSLAHSLIEDTIILLIIGADISGILMGRMIIALTIVFLFTRLLHIYGDKMVQKLVIPAYPKKQ